MIACPQCQAEVNEADNDCPSCGVIFNKWKERENNVASGNLNKYQMIAHATSEEFNWTILVIVAVAVGILLFFAAHNAREVLNTL